MILRSDTSTSQRGRKTFVLLGCERGGQYRRYKKDLQVTESGTRKCGCPFRLRGYPIKSGEGWILKLICGSHNHELGNTLVGHPYVGRFTCSEKSMLMDMTNSAVYQIHKFGSLPDPKIQNIPGIINSGFYRMHQFGM